MQPALDELHGDEVGGLARVEHEEPALLEGPELEADVDRVVGLHLREAEVGALGGEGDGVVHRLLRHRVHQHGVQGVVGELRGKACVVNLFSTDTGVISTNV